MCSFFRDEHSESLLVAIAWLKAYSLQFLEIHLVSIYCTCASKLLRWEKQGNRDHKAHNVTFFGTSSWRLDLWRIVEVADDEDQIPFVPLLSPLLWRSATGIARINASWSQDSHDGRRLLDQSWLRCDGMRCTSSRMSKNGWPCRRESAVLCCHGYVNEQMHRSLTIWVWMLTTPLLLLGPVTAH